MSNKDCNHDLKAGPHKGKPVPMELEPVRAEGKDSILVKMIKGYLTAQCVGFGILILTTPTCTMGATTRGRAQLKTRYMTSETQNLRQWGFESADEPGKTKNQDDVHQSDDEV